MDSKSVMATAQEKNNLHVPQCTYKKRVYSKEEGEEQKIELLWKRTLHVFDIVSYALSSIENLLQKGQILMTRLDMEDRLIAMKIPQV